MNNSSQLKIFPYRHPRPGQIKLIQAIQEDVSNRKHLCVEAANGFGKTIAALTGVVPLLKKQNFGLIYIARTHKQLDRTMEELKALAKTLEFNGIEMRGRKASCLNRLVIQYAPTAQLAMFICGQLKRSGRCRFYQNLLNKIKKNVHYPLKFCETPLTGLELRKLCQSEQICPYELTKLILPRVKVVTTTYYQIFDPQIGKTFFESFGRDLTQSVLVLDEAHNLPRIAIELASKKFSLHYVHQAVLEAKRYSLSSVNNLGYALENEAHRLLEENSSDEISLDPKEFNDHISKKSKIPDLTAFSNNLLQIGDKIVNRLLSAGKPPISYVYLLARFLVQWVQSMQSSDIVYFIIKNNNKPSDIRFELVALDPRRTTKSILLNCHSSVHLSGTLHPISAHIDLVGLPEDTRILNLPSPFSKQQIFPIISLGVTTAMRYRTPLMFNKIALKIAAICRATPHNVGVFVPSYGVLKALLNTTLESSVDKKLFTERPGLSSSENDTLIQSFKKYSNKGALLLGVLGGRNSEGEDYPGKEMETVVIVGVPFARPTPRESVRIEYLERHFPQKGRIYGYLLPAMRMAAQAAGRSVRGLEDRGAIVFLDDRYATPFCKTFFPSWIADGIICLNDSDEILFNRLVSFYNKE